jgi:hypothetical protein
MWSRFPSERLSEVLKAINPGHRDGVQVLWWRTPVSVIARCNSAPTLGRPTHRWVAAGPWLPGLGKLHRQGPARQRAPAGATTTSTAWRSFLRRQAAGILACAFLTVDTCCCNGCMSCASFSCTPEESTSLVAPSTPPATGSPSKPGICLARLMRRPASGSCSATTTASSPGPWMTAGARSVPRSASTLLLAGDALRSGATVPSQPLTTSRRTLQSLVPAAVVLTAPGGRGNKRRMSASAGL